MRASRRPYLGALILILFGVLLLLDNLGVADFGSMISTYWPLILILIGLSLLLRRRRVSDSPEGGASHFTEGDGVRETNAAVVNSTSVFGDMELRIASKEFRGGMISCTFGDVNVDLSGVALADGEHVLKIDGVFGDLHVLVPKDMEMMVTARAVFGDVRVLGMHKSGIGQEISYTTSAYTTAARRIRIQANQVFGDVKFW